MTITPRHLDALARAAVSPKLIRNLQSALGTYHSEMDYVAVMKTFLGTDWRSELKQIPKDVTYMDRHYGNLIGYRAEGWLGQYLYVFPEQALVVARLISVSSVQDQEHDSFSAFDGLVTALAWAI